jgi:hypothetical protein
MNRQPRSVIAAEVSGRVSSSSGSAAASPPGLILVEVTNSQAVGRGSSAQVSGVSSIEFLFDHELFCRNPSL